MGSAASVSQSDVISADEVRSLCSTDFTDVYGVFELLKDSNGQLSRSIFNKYYDAFKLFDNDDRSVDKPEALQIIKSLGLETVTVSFPDDRVHISSLVAELLPQLKVIVDDFRKLDTNGDGVIDATEIMEAIKQHDHEATIDDAVDIIKHADVNGDGSLDIMEYVKMKAHEEVVAEGDK